MPKNGTKIFQDKDVKLTTLCLFPVLHSAVVELVPILHLLFDFAAGDEARIVFAIDLSFFCDYDDLHCHKSTPTCPQPSVCVL